MKLTFQCRRQENKLSWTRKVSGSKSPKEVRKLGLLILAGREFYVARTVYVRALQERHVQGPVKRPCGWNRVNK